MDKQKAEKEEMLKQAKQEAFQLGNMMMHIRTRNTAWPTNLCADNTPVKLAFWGNADGPNQSKYDGMFLDPWGNPYHMTLHIFPPNPHFEAKLLVWSFGPNKQNNNCKKDDVVIRITTPNHGLESTSAPPAAGTLETHP